MQTLSEEACTNILYNLARIWAREHGCEIARIVISRKEESAEK